ncbi:hypothetical protein V1525DRAFT_393797 [Lipomyces kononenkoae]|uniref:Uncharacterized protein n=1 Tax=Lipomyces kononenkoae TaxID=34357 RepID=A0ACC3TAZ7_LIPKO
MPVLSPSVSPPSSSRQSNRHNRTHSFPAAISQVISRQLHSSPSSKKSSKHADHSKEGTEMGSPPGAAEQPGSLNGQKLATKEPSIALTTGLCMCCLSSLRYPVSIPCFRCTVCQTTNDVTPLPSKPGPTIASEYIDDLVNAEYVTEDAWKKVEDRVVGVFQSFDGLSSSFSNGKKLTFSETGLDFGQINKFYKVILSSSQQLMGLVLKSSEILLKRPGRILSSPSDLKFLLIILENPVLYAARSSQSSSHHSTILKRLFGLISSLNANCHHYLVNWFARLPAESFRAKVELINSFTTHRLAKFSSSRNGGVKIETYGADWRIRAAARTLSLFFAANIQVSKVPTSLFYNTLVDYIDITHDFDIWEKQGISSAGPVFRTSNHAGPSQTGSSNSPVGTAKTAFTSSLTHDSSSNPAVTPSNFTTFTFCQYPFYLSMGSKITILEYDARRQMEIKAREAFFSTINYKRIVQPHLVLKIRRNCIIEDSLRQISSNEMELKKGLKIEFIGEDGVDAGGLRKEWFLLLVREMFDPLNGMFMYDDESNYCWFNHSTFETSDQYFLVGVVLGLAIYNSTILDIHLPPALFKKLLGCACTMEDLILLKPSLARGLQQLLDYEGNVEETFCRDFVAEHDVYGSIVQVPLIPGGENKPVTNANRQEFVNKYIQFIFDVSVTRQFQPFKRGFYHVIGGNALTLFRPEEIELLVRGSDEGLDVEALRSVAVYDGWGNSNHTKMSIHEIEETEPLINWFWECFANMDTADQRRLLTFVTGSDRIPATGIANLIFKISKLGEDSERYLLFNFK